MPALIYALKPVLKAGTWEAYQTWGHDTSRALFPEKRGAFSKDNKRNSLFTAKSWGTRAPSAPRFLRLCSKVL